ncbi:MAG: cupin domain-containing protein [Acidobacteriota bacterium]
MTTFRIRKLHELVGGLKETTAVKELVRELEAKVRSSKVPFEGAALPGYLVEGRLPPGIASAWIFVLRPDTPTPPHYHPNSIQHMAVIQGGGTGQIGPYRFTLQPYDPAFPERSLLIIPERVPHSFEAGHETLAVMSFHTVAAEDLVEVEVETGEARTYLDRDARPAKAKPAARPPRPAPPRPRRPPAGRGRPAKGPRKPRS